MFVFQKMRYDIVIELPLLQYPQKAQQMMIFARTKPRGIVNDTHNNQRITEPNMVKDFKRALISRGIF